MKTKFLRPRFTGARFDEHTLPVDVARDLAAYEELVVELAKHLWLLEHPERERVPRGFEKEFSLHFDGMVEDGSAKPLLSCVVAGALALQGGASTYFEQARDIITACVSASAANQTLPDKFPKDLLDYFNVFGRSLREGESLELTCGNSPATLTPDGRKQLVLKAKTVYTKEIELSGHVGEIDWDKQTFRLRLETGTPVIAPLPEHFKELARQAGGKDRTVVLVRGVGVFDAYDHLQKLSDTDQLELMPNQKLADQIEELANLQDGWLDGQGKAPDRDQLAWATDRLVSTFPEDLPFPLTGPTPEGGLFLEWIQKSWRVSAELLLPGHQCELQATNTETSETADKDCNLDQPAEWPELYFFVRKYVNLA